MQRLNRLFLVTGLVAASMTLAACQKKSEEAAPAQTTTKTDTVIFVGKDGKQREEVVIFDAQGRRRDSRGYIILDDGRVQREDGTFIIEESVSVESLSMEVSEETTIEEDEDGADDGADTDDDGDEDDEGEDDSDENDDEGDDDDSGDDDDGGDDDGGDE